MALIALAVFDTEENQRTKYTKRTLESLFDKVLFSDHRLFIIDNASCEQTKDLLKEYANNVSTTLITNTINIGTAEAINMAWKHRVKGEHCVKMDNDVVVHSTGWIEELQEAIAREPQIGQIGLKRKDLEEYPSNPNRHFRSSLIALPHQRGQRWITVEKVNHVMGTCVMHSSALLDKVGYLKQYGIYGFDDSIMSFRSAQAGFINCFLPHIEIDHIDAGDNLYTKEKQELASKAWEDYQQLIKRYINGTEKLYYNPYEN